MRRCGNRRIGWQHNPPVALGDDRRSKLGNAYFRATFIDRKPRSFERWSRFAIFVSFGIGNSMPLIVPPDVEALVARHVASGRYRSKDDVLRFAMEALTEVDEDLAAVQETLDEWRSGDSGVPLEDAIRTVRTRPSHDSGS